MNEELEQLVEYAITDGFITDKEKKVLIKKAEKLGYDVDELEMVLEGRLDSIRKDQSENSSVRKCPSCGEILTAYAAVCDACDHVFESNDEDPKSLKKTIKKLDSLTNSLSVYPNTSNNHIVNIVFYIIITGGLHLLYRAIKGGPLFAREGHDYKRIVTEHTHLTVTTVNDYKKDPEIVDRMRAYIREAQGYAKARRNDALRKGLIWSGAAILLITGGVFFIKSLPQHEQTAAERVEDYIKAGNIGKAKEYLASVQDAEDKRNFQIEITELEVDSLINEAKDYDAALVIINLENNSHERENKVDDVLSLQIEDLLRNKDFKKARERAELASYLKKSELIEKIELAEKLNN